MGELDLKELRELSNTLRSAEDAHARCSGDWQVKEQLLHKRISAQLALHIKLPGVVVLALLDRLEAAETCAAKVPDYVGQLLAAERRLQQAKEWLDSKQVHAELSCSSWTRLRAILGEEE